MRPLAALLLVLAAWLSGAPALAQAPVATPLAVGQGIWRPRLGAAAVPDGAGGQRRVAGDLYALTVDQAQPVRVMLRTRGPLTGLVVDPAQADDQGLPREVGSFTARQPFTARLQPGTLLVLVSAETPVEEPYLLTADGPTPPVGPIQRDAAAAPVGDGPALQGIWSLGHPVAGVDVSADGRFVAVHDGERAWLLDIVDDQRYALPAEPGAIRRVAFSPDGWSLLVASAGGARLLGLPSLVPFSRMAPEAGGDLADAVFAGSGQRVALLPAGGPVYVTSPQPDDLAFLPDSRGLGLIASGSSHVGVRLSEREVAVLDSGGRQTLARVEWPAPPADLALHPAMPWLAGAGAREASRIWMPEGAPVVLPGPVQAVAYAASGALAVADADGVGVFKGAELTRLAPAFAAERLAFSSGGGRLAAAAGERIAVWDTALLTGLADDRLYLARRSYMSGLEALKAEDGAAARESFLAAQDLLATLEPVPDVIEYRTLLWWRLSEASHLLGEFQRALTEATEMLALAQTIADETRQRGMAAMAFYRSGDALWSLGRQDDARESFRSALDAGLTGPWAEDAQEKLGP